MVEGFGLFVFGVALDVVFDRADDVLPRDGPGRSGRALLVELAGLRDAEANAAGDALIGDGGLLDGGVRGFVWDLVDEARADVHHPAEDVAVVLRVLDGLIGFGGGLGCGHGVFLEQNVIVWIGVLSGLVAGSRACGCQSRAFGLRTVAVPWHQGLREEHCHLRTGKNIVIYERETSIGREQPSAGACGRDREQEASVVLATMGLTLSDAVRMLLTRAAREKALPFEPLVPNAETIAAMKEARRGKLATFKTVEAL